MSRKVIIESQQRVLDDFFQVDSVNVLVEGYDAKMRGPMRRLVFQRGDSVAALILHRDRDELLLVEQFRYPTYKKGPGWITETMAPFPVRHMTSFPWDWYTIDAEQGWIVGQVENRFSDPGDGKVYEGANWTRLVYAGDGLWASEEDVYNPARLGPVVAAWVEAWWAHHPGEPEV